MGLLCNVRARWLPLVISAAWLASCEWSLRAQSIHWPKRYPGPIPWSKATVAVAVIWALAEVISLLAGTVLGLYRRQLRDVAFTPFNSAYWLVFYGFVGLVLFVVPKII